MQILKFLAGSVFWWLGIAFTFYAGRTLHVRLEEKWWILPKIIGLVITFFGFYLIHESGITFLFDWFRALLEFLRKGVPQ